MSDNPACPVKHKSPGGSDFLSHAHRRAQIGNPGLLLLGLLFLAGSVAFGDEGMWLYNSFPKDKVKAKYGFEPSQQWLDHVHLSSVRFINGASGSFVSADGLTLTNHHVGAECIQQLSTGGRDYMKTGFYAHSLADEAKCPDLELNQLLTMEDLTVQVNAGVSRRCLSQRREKPGVPRCLRSRSAAAALPVCAAMWSLCIVEGFTTSTGTRNTTMFDWGLRRDAQPAVRAMPC